MTRYDRYGDPIEDDPDACDRSNPKTRGHARPRVGVRLTRGTIPASRGFDHRPDRPQVVEPHDPRCDPRCVEGWLGEDEDGHPVPCLVCRPHLTWAEATS